MQTVRHRTWCQEAGAGSSWRARQLHVVCTKLWIGRGAITLVASHNAAAIGTCRFFRPATWSEALSFKSDVPEAVPIHGGTDVMVELNFGRRRPAALLDLSRLDELADWSRHSSVVRIGAGVTYARIIRELADLTPALAVASRTVGSPQIRNRGTVGGNLGTASPAGDAHPPLLAAGAFVEAESVRGVREIPLEQFFTGPKRNALQADELIRAVTVRVAHGPQQFAKIGPRNAMVIATVSFALALHVDDGVASTGIGSAGPTPLRALEAEKLLAGELFGGGRLTDDLAARFGQLVADAASPIDDVRGTRDYRRHALSVLARRCLAWTWSELKGSNA